MSVDAAALGDNFRKTVQAAGEQARGTMTVAQEQLRHDLTTAQQMQGDVAGMVLSANEQGSQFMTAFISSFWDASFSMLSMATWGQEQTESVLLQAVEREKRAREEGTALLRDVAEQARRHQTELFRLAQESLRVGVFYAGKVREHQFAADQANPERFELAALSNLPMDRPESGPRD
jgi:hypothetical protein